MGRYLTPETLRLWLSGLGVGALTGLVWWAGKRRRWGAVPFLVAVFVAAGLNGRSDWPRWSWMSVAGGIVIVLAGAGAAGLLADPAVDRRWFAAGALASLAGVWAGVPETGPALLVGGSLAGLAGSAALARARLAPAAGIGLAAVVGWAALSGAAGRPWAAIGGTLCTGLAPWSVLRPGRTRPTGSRSAGPLRIITHGLLVVLAARWIGVVPHAGWARVAAVALIGSAVTLATRRSAMM